MGFNMITNGKEMPDTQSMLFVNRTDLTHNGKVYQIVVKSSRLPLMRDNGHVMYSVCQVLDSER